MPLSEKIFNEELREAVVHETLRWYLASRRRGTHSAKTRSEVRGGGIKPWRQKGTGRARAGSIRSPLWRKGGVIFPPKPRDYSYNLPKSMRKLALRIVLSQFNREDRLKVLPSFSLPLPKTSEGVKWLEGMGVTGKVLILLAENNLELATIVAFERGLRNIKGVKIITLDQLNIFELLNADWLVLENKTISLLEERLL
jgi:large subunit ribosomal protein L4